MFGSRSGAGARHASLLAVCSAEVSPSAPRAGRGPRAPWPGCCPFNSWMLRWIWGPISGNWDRAESISRLGRLRVRPEDAAGSGDEQQQQREHREQAVEGDQRRVHPGTVVAIALEDGHGEGRHPEALLEPVEPVGDPGWSQLGGSHRGGRRLTPSVNFATAARLMPFTKSDRSWLGRSPTAWMSGMAPNSCGRARRSRGRARCAPRQKCGPDRPEPDVGL